MFRSSLRHLINRPLRPLARRRLRTCLRLEPLEDRCVPVGTLTGVGFTSLNPQPTEGATFSAQVATVFDDGPLTPVFKVSINWGDGTPLDTTSGVLTPIAGSPDSFTVFGTHTYTEESSSVTPPFNFPVTVTVSDTANSLAAVVIQSEASVVDANLSQGNPLTETPQIISGVGGTIVSGGTATALNSFEAAIGGTKNTAPSPQNGGFRVINWDGVKTDGTDSAAGPNSTVVIPPNNGTGQHTVGIPLDRFETNGVFFGAVYAVSNDGFADVNSDVGGVTPLFPAFSSPNTFAMFNDNGIDFKFVAPSPDNTTIVSAASRGFGAVFLNVEEANTTTIQYFNGNNLLATVSAPVGGKGQPVFVGALFQDPIVTRAVLTLGTDVLFTFDGTTAKPGTVADNPGGGHNLVVTDDWAFAEPVPTPNGLPVVTGAQGSNNAALIGSATVGTPFSGVVASFTDQDPNGNAKDFTATINWGDGHLTNGMIAANTHGGFDISGTNTYAQPGLFPINVDIADFGGSIPTVSVNNTLVVHQPPTITSNPSTNLVLGQPGSYMITSTGFPISSLTESGALPSGVTFSDNGNGTATLAGTPGAGTAGTYNLMITAHNGFGNDFIQSFTLTVVQSFPPSSSTPGVTSDQQTTVDLIFLKLLTDIGALSPLDAVLVQLAPNVFSLAIDETLLVTGLGPLFGISDAALMQQIAHLKTL